jgi:hypothetical protein
MRGVVPMRILLVATVLALYGSNTVARPGRNVVRARRSSMRLDFGPPQDDEADEQFEAHMSAIHAALDAAVDIEDYAEAQRLKVIMDAATEARVAQSDAAWEAAAAATFTTPESPVPPTSMESLGGFRYDTRSTRSVAASSNAMSSQVRVDDEWTDALEELVCRQMKGAFDNYPPSEVEALLAGLVEASYQQTGSAERTLRKLAGLARQMEALEKAAERGAGAPEYLEDEARAVRSQIRMWGKDGEQYIR